MTFEQTRENLALVLAENAFINICECSDILNAIEALEKQMPKSVIRHGFDTNKLISTVSYTCPVCKSHISRTEYCPNCGQALDWRDTE